MLIPGIQLLGMQKIAIARMNMCCRMHTNRVAFSKKGNLLRMQKSRQRIREMPVL